jgi:hypothetical protein
MAPSLNRSLAFIDLEFFAARSINNNLLGNNVGRAYLEIWQNRSLFRTLLSYRSSLYSLPHFTDKIPSLAYNNKNNRIERGLPCLLEAPSQAHRLTFVVTAVFKTMRLLSKKTLRMRPRTAERFASLRQKKLPTTLAVSYARAFK